MAKLQYSDRQRLSETELTIGDLKLLIEQLIHQLASTPQSGIVSDRSVHEVLASMRRNVWTPPQGTTSNVELRREDRDQ